MAVIQQAQEDIARVVTYEELQDVASDMKSRVRDWKEHQPNEFGDLLLYEPVVEVLTSLLEWTSSTPPAPRKVSYCAPCKQHNYLPGTNQNWQGWHRGICRAYMFESILIFAKQVNSKGSLRSKLLQRAKPPPSSHALRLQLDDWIFLRLGGVVILSVDPGKFALSVTP